MLTGTERPRQCRRVIDFPAQQSPVVAVTSQPKAHVTAGLVALRNGSTVVLSNFIISNTQPQILHNIPPCTLLLSPAVAIRTLDAPDKNSGQEHECHRT